MSHEAFWRQMTIILHWNSSMTWLVINWESLFAYNSLAPTSQDNLDFILYLIIVGFNFKTQDCSISIPSGFSRIMLDPLPFKLYALVTDRVLDCSLFYWGDDESSTIKYGSTWALMVTLGTNETLYSNNLTSQVNILQARSDFLKNLTNRIIRSNHYFMALKVRIELS